MLYIQCQYDFYFQRSLLAKTPFFFDYLLKSLGPLLNFQKKTVPPDGTARSGL